jgi:hypothetical protein
MTIEAFPVGPFAVLAHNLARFLRDGAKGAFRKRPTSSGLSLGGDCSTKRTVDIVEGRADSCTGDCSAHSATKCHHASPKT